MLERVSLSRSSYPHRRNRMSLGSMDFLRSERRINRPLLRRVMVNNTGLVTKAGPGLKLRDSAWGGDGG